MYLTVLVTSLTLMHAPEDPQPWYRNHSKHPFYLHKKFSLNSATARQSRKFRSIAAFPWTRESPAGFWYDGDTSLNPDDWEKIVNDYSDAVVVGGDPNEVYIFFLRSAKHPIRIKLPEQKACDYGLPTDKINVAWTLKTDESFQPIIVITNRYLIYIYSIRENKIVSILRGHGNHITSIVVHPSVPYMFATTSRDFSTRLYDLKQKPKQRPNNPVWPPQNKPSLAGGAHGLDGNDPEGYYRDEGWGRCVMVLAGGPSGGHQGDVFAAAFHKHYPVIATCGMDRAVKIWHIPFPFLPDQKLVREDKPLFSSTTIHKARVLSIDWISDDILLTHSAPAIMSIPATDDEHPDIEPAYMVLWRWLGKDRFFPVGWNEHPSQQTALRGCASDYQESASFQILASINLSPTPTQFDTPSAFHVFREENHDPLLLYTYPQWKRVTIVNIADFPPRRPPPCRWMTDEELLEAARKLNISEVDEDVPSWQIELTDPTDAFQTCTMFPEGDAIVAAGGYHVWVWRKYPTD
ncbi:hypothetical protein E1B28_001047 [Marasmius oreades]|uniref:WD40 repeat-like protein n=1 Tax=Marasmius oreades TaxID=181124 RepID=A0A9P8AES2_9AGAR|nr:uncharacterized protein E1B28_001047 [Marasmius oreades]KAG7099176.1 hypothetical protein E1B28_001047 [Marasmius oreades]